MWSEVNKKCEFCILGTRFFHFLCQNPILGFQLQTMLPWKILQFTIQIFWCCAEFLTSWSKYETSEIVFLNFVLFALLSHKMTFLHQWCFINVPVKSSSYRCKSCFKNAVLWLNSPEFWIVFFMVSNFLSIFTKTLFPCICMVNCELQQRCDLRDSQFRSRIKPNLYP